MGGYNRGGGGWGFFLTKHPLPRAGGILGAAEGVREGGGVLLRNWGPRIGAWATGARGHEPLEPLHRPGDAGGRLWAGFVSGPPKPGKGRGAMGPTPNPPPGRVTEEHKWGLKMNFQNFVKMAPPTPPPPRVELREAGPDVDASAAVRVHEAPRRRTAGLTGWRTPQLYFLDETSFGTAPEVLGTKTPPLPPPPLASDPATELAGRPITPLPTATRWWVFPLRTIGYPSCATTQIK